MRSFCDVNTKAQEIEQSRPAALEQASRLTAESCQVTAKADRLKLMTLAHMRSTVALSFGKPKCQLRQAKVQAAGH